MHLQCSRMPAKVYNELSRRCGTRNVLINKDIGMDLLRGPEGLHGGVLFFMIKQKITRDKMRYSNLSNVIISEL